MKSPPMEQSCTTNFQRGFVGVTSFKPQSGANRRHHPFNCPTPFDDRRRRAVEVKDSYSA
ncbi:hypothetical protein AWB81_07058 [Caballeronia arationis]|nr:hypothetical protein AWB81_07058 [Caballeronia arationis]